MNIYFKIENGEKSISESDGNLVSLEIIPILLIVSIFYMFLFPHFVLDGFFVEDNKEGFKVQEDHSDIFIVDSDGRRKKKVCIIVENIQNNKEVPDKEKDFPLLNIKDIEKEVKVLVLVVSQGNLG